MFKVYWEPGKVNLVDYISKHHPASHVKKVRKLYLNELDSSRTIVACNKYWLNEGVAYKGVLSLGYKTRMYHTYPDSNVVAWLD